MYFEKAYMTKLGFRFPCIILRMTKIRLLYTKLVEVPLIVYVEKYNHLLQTHKNLCCSI